MRRGTAIVAAATSGLAMVAGGLLLTGGAASAETVPADIKGYEYAPGDVTIAAGDTVTWTNSDTAPHTVTSTDGGPLDSPNLQKGDSWSFTFTQAGSYAYYCAVHPDMKATVTVTGAPAAPTTTAMPGHEAPTSTAPPPAESPTTTAVPAPPAASTGSTVGAFWQHFEAAHLETSPGQQVADALALDQYVLTHTVMVENMLAPLLGGGADGSVGAFWAHFQAGHLETSPGNQVAEALSLDQYVLTHTVLIENMLAPLVGG